MDFLIGETFGALLSLVLVAPLVIIIYLINYNKYDSDGDGLSG
jgi:hypothetical protein